MTLYLSNPHQVDAIQYTDSNGRAVTQWCNDNGHKPEILTAHSIPYAFRFSADVNDSGESQTAEVGDWIVRYENGKYEVMDESTFEATYSEYRP